MGYLMLGLLEDCTSMSAKGLQKVIRCINANIILFLVILFYDTLSAVLACNLIWLLLLATSQYYNLVLK